MSLYALPSSLLLLFIVLLSSLLSSSVESVEQLELVSIVFRHGGRSPVTSYPNDPYQEEAWPQGFGQLTIEGMKEEYHLGQLLKSRYIDSGYMSANYTRQEVYVRSTDYDRTLMSAQCVLAGLYPINNTFINGLNWQPIPVHSVIGSDYLLRAGDSCTTYKNLRKNDQNSVSYKDMSNSNQDLFDRLSQYAGYTVNLTSVWTLQDTLFVENYNNLTTPVWYTKEMKMKLQSFSDYNFLLMFDSFQKRQLTGGVWANKVLQDIENKINDKSSKMKLYLYSAHDTTVSAMLSVFDLFNGLQPPYSSAFIIELYSDNNNYYVKFLYHNETWSNTLIELIHPNCTNNCTIHNIQQIMDPFRLNETELIQLCQQENIPSNIDYTGLSTGIGVVGMMVIILLTVMSYVVVKMCLKRKTLITYAPMVNQEELSGDEL